MYAPERIREGRGPVKGSGHLGVLMLGLLNPPGTPGPQQDTVSLLPDTLLLHPTVHSLAWRPPSPITPASIPLAGVDSTDSGRIVYRLVWRITPGDLDPLPPDAVIDSVHLVYDLTLSRETLGVRIGVLTTPWVLPPETLWAFLDSLPAGTRQIYTRPVGRDTLSLSWALREFCKLRRHQIPALLIGIREDTLRIPRFRPPGPEKDTVQVLPTAVGTFASGMLVVYFHTLPSSDTVVGDPPPPPPCGP